MPQIDLYLAESDEAELARAVLARGAALVADLWYPKPQYSQVEDLHGFISARRDTRQFYVLHQDFSHLPLELVRQGVDIFRYYIMPRNGGPAISFLCGGIAPEAAPMLRPGGLHYYPSYWDQISEVNRRAPAQEVALYKDLLQEIRKSYRRIKLKARVAWVGPFACEAVNQGVGLVGVDALQLKRIRVELDGSAKRRSG